MLKKICDKTMLTAFDRICETPIGVSRVIEPALSNDPIEMVKIEAVFSKGPKSTLGATCATMACGGRAGFEPWARAGQTSPSSVWRWSHRPNEKRLKF